MVRTCGRACSAYEVKIWNSENTDVEAPKGEIGEIGGRGACLMLGYFGNQTETENSFNKAGWFLSGDLGRFDENGNLEIVGARKSVVEVKSVDVRVGVSGRRIIKKKNK